MYGIYSPLRSRLARASTATLLISALSVQALPPSWWKEPYLANQPALDGEALESNHGAASVGQGKWMAQNALEALKETLGASSPVVTAIQNELYKATENASTGVFYPVRPETPSAAWLDTQRAPLRIGMLKSLAAPFYKHLSAFDADWTERQLQESGLTLNEGYFEDVDGTFYPWDPADNGNDEKNHAMATVGQIKIAFALDFAGDFEGNDYDGLSDLWELAVVKANPSDSWTAISQINASNASTAGAATGRGNPPSDRDGDGVKNAVDASPDDPVIDWWKSPEPCWVPVKLSDLGTPPTGGYGFMKAIGDGGDILASKAIYHDGAWHELEATPESLSFNTTHGGYTINYVGDGYTNWNAVDAEGTAYGYATFLREDGDWTEDEEFDPNEVPGNMVKVVKASPPNYEAEVMGTTGNAFPYSVHTLVAGGAGVVAIRAGDVLDDTYTPALGIYRPGTGFTFEAMEDPGNDFPYSVDSGGRVVGSNTHDDVTDTPFYRGTDGNWDTDIIGPAADVVYMSKGAGPQGDAARTVINSVTGVLYVRKPGEQEFQAAKRLYLEGGEYWGTGRAISRQGWTIGEPGLGGPDFWLNGEWHPLEDFLPVEEGVSYGYPYEMNESGAILTTRTTEGQGTDEVVLMPVEVKDVKGAGTADDQVIHPMDPVPTQNQGESNEDFWRRRNAYFQQDLADAHIAMIDPHRGASNSPDMPQLVVSSPGGPNGAQVSWRLEVEYLRGNGYRANYVLDFTRPEDKVRVPAANQGNPTFTATMDAGAEWAMHSAQAWTNEITANGFFGGTAKIYLMAPGQQQPPATPVFTFRIGGKNPTPALARTYINATAGQTFWYAYAMAKHETFGRVMENGVARFYNQFYTDYQGPNGRIGDASLDMGWAAWAKGWPLYNLDRYRNRQGVRHQNGPGGYGLYQLTWGPKLPNGTQGAGSAAFIPRRMIWNWQDNAGGAITELQGKLTLAQGLHNGLTTSYSTWPAIPNEGHLSGLEAITVTLYNGTQGLPSIRVGGRQRRTPWTPVTAGGGAKVWRFHQNSQNYVQRVNFHIEP